MAGNGDGDRPGRPVLDGFNLVVRAGETHAIVGSTGAGKSTVVKLLLRLYDPTAGEILLDGVDLRDYRLADLRAQFAIVLQHPLLFSTTIAENIAYSRPDASAAGLMIEPIPPSRLPKRFRPSHTRPATTSSRTT